jgi:hypothetical protein
MLLACPTFAVVHPGRPAVTTNSAPRPTPAPRRLTAGTNATFTRVWQKGLMTASHTHHPTETPRAPTGIRSIGSPRVEVVVAVVDPTGRTERMEQFLPRRWTTSRFNNIYELERPELLVLGNATPFLVAAARLLHPQATLLAVIDAEAPPSTLVGLLQSGADVCVREGAMHILATHLIACYRRRARRNPASRRLIA